MASKHGGCSEVPLTVLSKSRVRHVATEGSDGHAPSGVAGICVTRVLSMLRMGVARVQPLPRHQYLRHSHKDYKVISEEPWSVSWSQ